MMRKVQPLLSSPTNRHVCFVADFECSLRNRQINRYLDTDTRTWRIDDSALDQLENDLQSVVNCTQEGDIILFNVSEPVRPARRVTIPWNLTLSADTDSTDPVDDLFPRARNKAILTCPEENVGVLFVRYLPSIHDKSAELKV